MSDRDIDALLRAARNDLRPSRAQRSRMRKRMLDGALRAGALSGLLASLLGSGSAVAAVSKAVAACTIAGAVIVGGSIGYRAIDGDPREPPRRQPAIARARPDAGSPRAERAPEPPVALPIERIAPSPSPTATALVISRPAASATRPSTSRTTRAVSRAREPSDPIASPSALEIGSIAPAIEPRPPILDAAPSELGAEAELLRTALLAIRRRDVVAASAALDRHAARFAGGALARERDALRAELADLARE